MALLITLDDRNPTFFPANQSVDLFANVVVAADAGDNFSQLVLTVTNVTQGTNERLLIDGTTIELTNGNSEATGGPLGVSANVSLSGSTATVTITLPAGFDATELTALIEAMEYENVSALPGMARRVVTLTSVSDNSGPNTLALSSIASPSTVTELVSVSTDGVQTISAPLALIDTVRSVSFDGRYVVFTGSDPNLAAGDTNGSNDIYLRDRLNGTTTRVSLASDGSQANAGSFTTMPSISDDGRYVAFLSSAQLTPTDFISNASDMFVRDLVLGTTICVSLADNGAGDNHVSGGEISGNGQFAAFTSSNPLIVNDTNIVTDVYVRNIAANTTTRVSVADDESQANDASFSASISADGTRIAFQSAATNLIGVGNDTNGVGDIFLRNTTTGTTVRVSVADDEAQANDVSSNASVSADGNIVAFQSRATNLTGVADPTGAGLDIYVRDISAGTTIRIPTPPGFPSGDSERPSISADGRYVAFSNSGLIWTYDIQTGQLNRVSTTADNRDNADSVVISGDGSTVVFFSSFNLVPYDVNATVFTNEFGQPSRLFDVFATPLSFLALGGTIWKDDGAGGGIAGDGIRNGAESGVGNVLLSLLADTNNDDIPDDINSPLQATVTAADGSYSFMNLAPGSYIVRVDQTNFVTGDAFDALVTTQISPVTSPEPPDPDNDVDNDDNGSRAPGEAAFSKAITLAAGTEPTTDGDALNGTNLTLDFGFFNNSPPVIANLGGDTSTFTEGGPAVLLDDSSAPEVLASVTDDQASLNNGSLTVSITGNKVAAEDVLGISTAGTVLLSSGTSVGSTVSVGGTAIGTIAAGGTGSGTDNLVITFNASATPVLVSTLIQALTYADTNALNPSTLPRTIAVSVNDGRGGIDTENVTVNVVDVNDEPTLIANAAGQTFTEGDALPADVFTLPIVASTVESGQTFASLTLTVTNVTDGPNEALVFNGTVVALTNGNNVAILGGNAAVSLSATTATVVLTGLTLTATDLQTLVDGLGYQNLSESPTDADRLVTITQLVDSGLNTPPPNDSTTTLSIASTVNVDAVNDPPAFAGLDATPTFVEDGPAVVLDSNATVSDAELDAANNYNGATLTLVRSTGTNPDDVFNDGSGTLTFGATAVSLTGTGQVGTYTHVSGTLVITFDSNATSAAVDSVLQQLTYRNTSDNPTTPVTIDYTFSDGNAGSQGTGATPGTATGSIVVGITPVNDAPVLDLDSSAAGSGFQVQFIPGVVAVPVPVADLDSSIVDVDDANIEQATITITNPQAGDVLSVLGPLLGGITVDPASTATNLILTGSATKAAYETALEQVRYNNTNPTPDQTTRLVNITVNDGTDPSNTAIASIVLNAPPTTPVDTDATADAVTEGAAAGTLVGIDVNSTDPEVPPTTVTYSFAPAGDAGGRFAIDSTTGVVSVSATGATTIDFEGSGGSYAITIRATDGAGAFSDQGFTVTVNNVAPTQPVDGNGGANSVVEGATNGTAVGVTASSTDVNGGTVSYTITAGNADGAFAIGLNTGIITVADATKIDFETATSRTLTVQASDGTTPSATQDFLINVTNAAPVFNADNNGGADTVSEGAVNGATVGITANFVDPNGGTVSYSLFDDAGGRFTIDPTTGVVTVANAALLNFESNTSHNITVRGSDPSGAFNDQGFSIVVTNVAPVATGDGYAVAEDGTLSVAAATGVLGNDSDVHGGGITAVLDVGPANAASFTLNADGSFSYTPNADFNGPDSFTYHAFDGTAAGNTVTVNLTVTEANDPPTATDDPLSSIAEDSGTRAILFTDLTGNDSKGPANENGQTLTVTAVNNAIGGSVAIVAGHVEFTPDANFNGAASFDYTTTDNGTTNGVGDPKSDVGHVAFTVTSVNDAPVLGGVPASRLLPADGTALNVAPTLTVGDVDSSSLTSATVRVSAGSFVGANDVLAANTAGTSITAFYDPATETLTLSGSDTLAHYQQVLASVTFDTTDTNPGNSGLNPTRTIEWQLNDGSGANNLSSIATTTINVSQQSPSDFNGDAVSDVLWRLNNGFVAEWLMSEGAISQNLGVALPDPVWHFQDTGDFGADGMADILWRHDNGQVVLWQMDGATILSNQSVAVIGNDWHNEGVADFNGDGKADVLWHNDSGQVALWTMDGAQITNNQSVGNIDASWHVQGLLDTGGDGKSDVLLRNDSGQVVLWTMDGAQITNNQSVTNNLGLDWNIVGTGDFGGDGKDDVLLRNDSGQVVIWTMDGNQIVDNQSVGTPGNEWQVQDVGDYNLDGKSDVLWRNDSGQVVLWEMNGNQIVSNHTVTYQGGTPAPIGLEWTVQNHHYDVL